MNKRIKELAEQARNYALDEKRIYERVHNTEQCMEIYREGYNEKFAELLVQETLEVARAGIEYGDGMETAVYTYFGLGMTTEDKKTLIKELLGVKND